MYKGQRADSRAFFLARRGSAFSITCSVAVLLQHMGMLEESTVEEDMATFF
jgi:hypothetical protein